MEPVNSADLQLSSPAPWGLPTVLPNGTRILLRPIMPGDKAKLQWGMGRLSPLARRQRFFSAKDELDEQDVTYLTEIDYRSHVAWVAVDLDREDQPIVAVGRYIRQPEDPATAEIAFVVGDEYQRQGLATMLLDLLTVVARANRIDHFYARVLADNVAMRHILTAAGAKLELDDAGVLQTTMDLPPSTEHFAASAIAAIVGSAAGQVGRLPAE
ncbi:MAG TPA: GNAT family N-acetyltransferase [Acidimicrobiales bacterium]|nr:GNAT family N-acetyltransferase [Acidimicrobiales bacterium]